MVSPLALPESRTFGAGPVSLSSPRSTRVELNLIFCSLYGCLACLVVSLCRESLAGPILGLFPMTATSPLFCRPKAELIAALKEEQRGDFLPPGCLSFQGAEAADWLLGSGQDPRLGREGSESS